MLGDTTHCNFRIFQHDLGIEGFHTVFHLLATIAFVQIYQVLRRAVTEHLSLQTKKKEGTLRFEGSASLRHLSCSKVCYSLATPSFD